MTQKVRAPDGQVLGFPDTMTADEIKAVMRQKFPPQSAEALAAPSRIAGAFEAAEDQPLSTRDTMLAATGGAIEGIPIAGPYLREGLNKLGAVKRSFLNDTAYGDELQNLRTKQEWLKQDRPLTSTAAQVAGSVASMVPLGATALGAKALGITGKNLLTRTAASTASGTAIGGLDAGARSDWNPADIRSGSAWGAGLGAVAPAIGQAVGAAARGLTGGKARGLNVPSTKELKGQSRAVRAQADAQGLVLSDNAFQRMIGRLTRVADDFGSDPALQPQALSVLRRMKADAAAGVQPTLEQMDKYHKMLGQVARAKSLERPADGTLAGVLSDRLDGYMRMLGASDVAAGDPQAAMSLVRQHRELWTRAKKSEKIGELLRVAQLRRSGVDKGTRNELMKLFTREKEWRRLTKEEQKALTRAIQGGTTENIINALGMFGRGILMPTLGFGAGYQYGGMDTALAGLAGAAGLRRLGARMTTGNARVLEATVRNGGTLPTRPLELGGRNVSQALLLSSPEETRRRASSP